MEQFKEWKYKFFLPELPYAYNALEPYISKQIMELHHDKHHRAYVNNLNAAIESNPDLQNLSLFDLVRDWRGLPESCRQAVRNNGGGHMNHTMFWKMMTPSGGGQPTGVVEQEIEKTFGGFEPFKQEFNKAAKTVFGSGWAWLCVDETGNLIVSKTSNQDNPISDGLHPILGLDVWEHAYYLQYYNLRPDYIDAWWSVVNWKQVEENYKAAVK